MIHGGYWECGWCGDCGTLRRCQQPIPEKIEEELPELTPESLAATAGPDTALLLRKFSEYLSAWDMDELSAMGASEIIERAYGEDQETGIAMWGTLLRTAGSRLKSPREAEWLLHTCCPYGEDDFCETLLDELARNEKLVCCILQSAYVGAEQYHLIDAAAESGRPELMARFMAALGGNTFPKKSGKSLIRSSRNCVQHAAERQYRNRRTLRRFPMLRKRTCRELSRRSGKSPAAE